MKKDLREVAGILYMQGYLQKEIATKLGVTEKTVAAWKKKDNWDAIKTSLLNSKNERITELYNELAEFNAMIKKRTEGERYPSSREADVRRKLIRDISELEKKYNIGQTTVIARDFVLFAKDIDFDFSQKASEYLDMFINHLIHRQKWQNQ